MKRDAQSSDFRLRKLYLDCVSPTGAVLIAYSGNIHWKSFDTGVSNVTVYDPNEKTRSRWMLEGVEPRREGTDLHWDAQRLASYIAMRACAGGFAERLLHSERGDVDWNCIVPVADVSVEFEGDRFEGTGYAEMIELTIPPWSLPIDRLRWGRFLGDGQNLTWIEWQGTHPLSRAWRNGLCLTPLEIGNDKLVLERDVRLEMPRSRVLRCGTLERLLSPVSALLRMFPVGRIHETRWLSAGHLRESDGRMTAGWVVHEEVSFR